jgi:short subunit dehydrogenase-like uncharacterized protein
MSRPFDLIVWGATGFTGQLVARYLHRTYGDSLRWAIAGRNQEKLERLRERLGAPALPLLTGDSHDQASLEALAAQSKVICTTVGPYALHGSDLVAACVAQGTHYCDLTGEVQWMRRMIDQHHAAAQAKGVKIVHTCGFDSIPSDLGVMFLQQEAKAKHGTYCTHIGFRLKGASGGFSGGTLASLNNVVAEAAQDRSVARILADPYALNPEGERQGSDGPDQDQARYDPVAKAYTAPFVMASINTRVVRRSHALQGYPYGDDFRYDEATLTGSGVMGQVAAWGISLGMGLVQKATPGSPMRWVMDTFLPKPGQGPSERAQEAGYFKVSLYGTLPDGSTIRADVSGDRDPGYGATSRMLSQSALCLAQDELPPQCGVLTPAVAMGDALRRRLEAQAGLKFQLR